MPSTLAILCGPGRDPAPSLAALAELRALFDEVLLCVADPAAHLGRGLPLVADLVPGAGAAAGLHAALAAARHPSLVAIAGERAAPDPGLLSLLAAHPSPANALLLERAGRLAPFPGRYRRGCLRVLRGALGGPGAPPLEPLLRRLHCTRLREDLEPGL